MNWRDRFKSFLSREPIQIHWTPVGKNFITSELKTAFPNANIHGYRDVQYQVRSSKIVRDWIKECPKFRKYTRDIFDCDDFAIWFKAFMSQKFGLNSVAYVEGNSKLGYHAFSVVVCHDGVFIIEPQTLGMWNLEENQNVKYEPKFILI